MAPLEEMHTAMVNKSIRTIKAELEFLTDASIITPQVLSELLNKIPQQTALHAPISVGAVPSSREQAGQLQPPTDAMAAMNTTQQQSQPVNEKRNDSYYGSTPDPAPPAYGAPPQPSWPPLCQATALYAYSSADKGDLELQPNDQINVTEYLNAEWWKGTSTRTNMTGIFPRSYVRVNEAPQTKNQVPQPTNYGNVPVDVAQGSSAQGQQQQGDGAGGGKVGEAGKKFGKKLGNAAIFGAGATIGSNIVNSIF